MADLALTARPRTVLGKKVKRLRRAGVTPANIYGHNVESLAIEADEHDLSLLLRRAGRTALIQVTIDGEGSARPVLVRDVSKRATNDQLLHVDFFQVSMLEKLLVDVPLTLTGTAPAVEQFDAVIVQNLETVSVQCLPNDIPSQIGVDISTLVDLASSIFVRDLQPPAGVEIMTDGDISVVTVNAQSQEAEAAEAEAVEAAEEAPAAEPAAEPKAAE